MSCSSVASLAVEICKCRAGAVAAAAAAISYGIVLQKPCCATLLLRRYCYCHSCCYCMYVEHRKPFLHTSMTVTDAADQQKNEAVMLVVNGSVAGF
jgi:hypothetical protein